jgi:hypothetical protein
MFVYTGNTTSLPLLFNLGSEYAIRFGKTRWFNETEWSIPGVANSGQRATCGPPRQSEKFNLVCYPITAVIEALQLELIDMQSDHCERNV